MTDNFHKAYLKRRRRVAKVMEKHKCSQDAAFSVYYKHCSEAERPKNFRSRCGYGMYRSASIAESIKALLPFAKNDPHNAGFYIKEYLTVYLKMEEAQAMKIYHWLVNAKNHKRPSQPVLKEFSKWMRDNGASIN